MTEAKGDRWSVEVTRHSDALDLEEGVFRSYDPQHIAIALKWSTERSRRRKAEPFGSAMSMLTFYINRADGSLPQRRRKVLERAKIELHRQFGRAPR